jgi:hypothetical protein
MKGGPSRRLIIGLTLFLIDSNSILNSTYYDLLHRMTPQSYEASCDARDHSRSSLISEVVPEQQVVWLVDEDEMCFGAYGFSSCGEINAWNLHHIHGEQYWLESFIDVAANANDRLSSNDQFLSASKLDQIKQPVPVLGTGDRSKIGYNRWNYNSEAGKLSIDIFDPIQENMESFCLSRPENNHLRMSSPYQIPALLQNCKNGYTRLEAVSFPALKANPSSATTTTSTSTTKRKIASSSYWMDPETNLLLPKSIKLEAEDKVQSFVGAGVYTKVRSLPLCFMTKPY